LKERQCATARQQCCSPLFIGAVPKTEIKNGIPNYSSDMDKKHLSEIRFPLKNPIEYQRFRREKQMGSVPKRFFCRFLGSFKPIFDSNSGGNINIPYITP
jgi:hypothetical protein